MNKPKFLRTSLLGVSGAAIAFAACLGAPAVFAQEMQYVGNSGTLRQGNVGNFTFHSDCDAAIEGSTFCTSEMIIKGGPSSDPTPPLPDLDPGEWVNPVFSGFDRGFAFDFSGLQVLASPNPFGANCTQWSQVNGTGLVIQTTPAGGVNFTARGCGGALPAACCMRED